MDDLERKDAELLANLRTDFLDFPTAWAIQRRVELQHDPLCSSVESDEHPLKGPFFLCDCRAVPAEWERRVTALTAPSTAAPEVPQ